MIDVVRYLKKEQKKRKRLLVICRDQIMEKWLASLVRANCQRAYYWMVYWGNIMRLGEIRLAFPFLLHERNCLIFEWYCIVKHFVLYGKDHLDFQNVL